MVVGHTNVNLQELYQRAVKIARVIEEIEAENREPNLGKRKFGVEESIFQRNRNFKKTNTRKSQNRGK